MVKVVYLLNLHFFKPVVVVLINKMNKNSARVNLPVSIFSTVSKFDSDLIKPC